MRFGNIIRRVTGLSTPIFGVLWNPPESEVAVARRVISFLEDRRVLYIPSEMETPDRCVKSVLEIRSFLTKEIGLINDSNSISESLKAMRSACRKFMSNVEKRPEIIQFGSSNGHWASWEFNGSIGELRGVFGIHITTLATAHGLDVEDDLATIMPSLSDNNE